MRRNRTGRSLSGCLFQLRKNLPDDVDGPEATLGFSKAIGTRDLLAIFEGNAVAVDASRSVQGLITIDGDLRSYREGILRIAQPHPRVRRKGVHKPCLLYT